jgi:hypothetical protein
MARIGDAVARYLAGRDWPFQEIDDLFATPVTGTAGNWMAYFVPREEDEQLLVYSGLRATVPTDRLDAVLNYLTRANFDLAIGNFEANVDDGQVRFKTSIDVAGAELSDPLIDHLFMANVASADRYLPGLEAVIVGTDPAAAIETAEG